MQQPKLTSIMVSKETRDLVKNALKRARKFEDVRMRPLAERYLTNGANKHIAELKKRKASKK